MDAAKIIDEIKLLPADEQVKVIEYIRTIPNEETIQALDEPSDTLQRFNSVDALFSELESWCFCLFVKVDSIKTKKT